LFNLSKHKAAAPLEFHANSALSQLRWTVRCGASASDRFLIDPTIRWCGDERPERVDKCHWPKSGRTAGMGGEETFFVIRPVDPSKMVPKLAGV